MAENVEAWTLLSLALATILIRISVRWKLVGPANFQLDDYLMLLAGVFFTLNTITAYLVGAEFDGLTNSYMTPEHRASLSPNSKEWSNRVSGSKIQVVEWSLYVAILWLVKLALTVFYSRLTTGLQHLPTRVRLAYIILAVTYLAIELSILLSCQPFHSFWQINPDPGKLCQPTNSPIYVFVVVILNVITDIYLLSIPLPLLWQVKIGLRRKIPLIALFSGATFVIIAATMRTITIVTSGPEGAIAGSMWACRETFVSVVVSNLPIIQPLIRQGFRSIGLFQRSSSSGEPSGQSSPLSSRNLQSTTSPADRCTKGSKSAAGQTHTEVFAWRSDEYILYEPEPISKGITVVSETIVRSEPWATEEGQGGDHVATSLKEWEVRSSG